MTIWRANPSTVAEELAQQTGVEVIAARDGMEFPLPGGTETQEEG